jgi:hypothetical protein
MLLTYYLGILRQHSVPEGEVLQHVGIIQVLVQFFV